MNERALQHPSAFIPLAMSLAALALVLVYATLFGTEPHEDEGAPARIFQLLIAGQLPIVAHFALTWVPGAPARAMGVLLLQALGAAAAVGTVMWLEW